MGYAPPPPRPLSAAQALAQSERRLLREVAGRSSRLSWRRRRAHQATLALIRMREALLGFREDPWVVRPPPKPEDVRYFDGGADSK